MVSSKSSNFNDNFQSSNSIINYETIDHNSSLISYQNNSLYNKNNSEFNCVVEALTDRIEKLEADNRELLERQTQKSTCGVCMDNSVFFYLILSNCFLNFLKLIKFNL